MQGVAESLIFVAALFGYALAAQPLLRRFTDAVLVSMEWQRECCRRIEPVLVAQVGSRTSYR